MYEVIPTPWENRAPGSDIVLRPYQSDTLDVLRGEFRQGRKRVIMYSPTGSGKTEMAMEMIRLARAKGLRVAFVVNRIGLVEQASRRFHRAGIAHGVIQGSNTRGIDQWTLICSIQTLARRGFPDVDMLVVDECHGCAGSKAYRDLLTAYAGKSVIGLTATPFTRGLGRECPKLGKLFETIAMKATIRDLIDLGFLVDVDIFAPGEPDLSGVKVVRGDYHEAQLAEAVDKPVLIGDIVTHWQRLGGGKRTVVFATSIAHSQHVVEKFKAMGVPAEHIDCYTEEAERRAILERLERGDTTIVSNVAVLAEGWDCPAVEVMILARPTRSLVRYIQMAGRVLRPAPGKSKALMLDHSGSAKRLGYPTDDLPLVLDDGKPKKSANTRAHDDPLPTACPACHFLKPPKIHACPACGFAPQKRTDVTTQAGDLVRLQPKKMPTAEKERIYAELLGYAVRHGYKPGWAYHKVKEFCGSHPGRHVAPREPSEATLRWIRSRQIAWAKSKERQREVARV